MNAFIAPDKTMKNKSALMSIKNVLSVIYKKKKKMYQKSFESFFSSADAGLPPRRRSQSLETSFVIAYTEHPLPGSRSFSSLFESSEILEEPALDRPVPLGHFRRVK